MVKNNLTLGVIARMDRHEFSSYYHASIPYFKTVKVISSINDLSEIDVLLCGNDHFQDHKNIWGREDFIGICNQRNIPFLVHTVERIDAPKYPHNLQIQAQLRKYHNLHQRCWDPLDAKKYSTKGSLARVLLSKKHCSLLLPKEKKKEIVFAGKLYDSRIQLISTLSKKVKVNVLPRDLNRSYYDYLSLLAEYKYVLSPLSEQSNGIPGRFYESLWVKSIPLQEVNDITLMGFEYERSIPGTIFFHNVEDLMSKFEASLDSYTPKLPKMFLEEELESFFIESGVLQ